MKPTDIVSPSHFHHVVNCQYACPAHTPVPEYIRLISEKRYTDAYMVNWDANVFPGVLGRVCDRPCEPSCRRGRVEDKPVAICRLKRVAADRRGDISDLLPEIPKKKNGKRIALIGAGPASLTVARNLMPLGYEVVLFDREERAGGMVRSQIPSFRLPEKVLNDEIDLILNMGVETRFGTEIKSLNKLLADDFDAVFIGSGAPSGRNMKLPGGEKAADHIHIGIQWLSGVSFGHTDKIGKKVVVLGGGNTAMDCCRTALRLGGKTVKSVVRSTYGNMKASPWEVEDAISEGIEIVPNHTPKEFVVKNGKLKGVLFQQVESVYDDDGNRILQPTKDAPTLIECDDVLIAVGQDASFPWIERDSGVAFNERGMPVVDEHTLQSTQPKVFFGGDAAFGPQNIITAVAHGQKAAYAIHQFCQDETVVGFGEYGFSLESQKMGIHEWSYNSKVSLEQRVSVPHASKKKALSSLQVEVELGFDEELALQEAARCLNCDVQTVFQDKRCIECNACVDICPMDCINFTQNDEEDVLRQRLRVPALNKGQALYVSGELTTGRIMIKDEDVCLHCGLCAERCPTSAWDMQKFLLQSVKAA